jgi:hypothetical protein
MKQHVKRDKRQATRNAVDHWRHRHSSLSLVASARAAVAMAGKLLLFDCGLIFVHLMVPTFMLAGFAVNSAIAQNDAKDARAASEATMEKGKTAPKVLLENDKVRVFEVRYKPGDEHATIPTSSFRVVRVLSGGTMMRRYADGTTKKIEHTTGEVKINEPSKLHYVTKNIGETDVHLYVVVVKKPKE